MRYCYNERFLSVGIQEEGIYRLSGVKSKVQALLDRFMAGECLQGSEYTEHGQSAIT